MWQCRLPDGWNFLKYFCFCFCFFFCFFLGWIMVRFVGSSGLAMNLQNLILKNRGDFENLICCLFLWIVRQSQMLTMVTFFLLLSFACGAWNGTLFPLFSIIYGYNFFGLICFDPKESTTWMGMSSMQSSEICEVSWFLLIGC